MKQKIFMTIKQFRDYYKLTNRYPIKMEVTEKERDIILSMRGGYTEKPDRAKRLLGVEGG